MKKLLLTALWYLLLLFQAGTSSGQTIILTEDFSGFTTGTHPTPSTNDVSLSLDTKTSVKGWKGNLIYSAGGEIKIGTSALTGWIETPAVDLSLNGGNCKIAFDIARWTGDATTVQVYLDGSAAGNLITPSDNYARVEIQIISGTSISKVKIQALTKRFFIDNFSISTDNVPTSSGAATVDNGKIHIWPLPVKDELNIENIAGYVEIVLGDLSGRFIKSIPSDGHERITVNVGSLEPGIYLLFFRSNKTSTVMKFIKY
jgi:hypothetical protein